MTGSPMLDFELGTNVDITALAFLPLLPSIDLRRVRCVDSPRPSSHDVEKATLYFPRHGVVWERLRDDLRVNTQSTMHAKSDILQAVSF